MVLSPSLARAAPRVVLAGRAGACALQRTADELQAAAYEVIAVPGDSDVQDDQLAALAQQRDSRAAIAVHGSGAACWVSIYVLSSTTGESSLRRLPTRWAGDRQAESLLALRVVEVLNGARLELEQARKRIPDASRVVPRGASSRRPRQFALLAAVRGLWMAESAAGFVGPELTLGIGVPGAWFVRGVGFVSASSLEVRSSAGAANVRVFAVGMATGWSFALTRALTMDASASARLLGAWADVQPALGYREVPALSRSAAFTGDIALGIAVTPRLAVGVAVGFGHVVPPVAISLAGSSAKSLGPWLAQASLGLGWEWE